MTELIIGTPAAGLGAFAAGLIAWSFVEYLIHGILAHGSLTQGRPTFVTPMHWGHHRNAHNVFTSPIAWVPVSLLFWAAGALLFGVPISNAFTAGLLLGFGRYEYVHWRIHFRLPRNPREQRRRVHHLAHHFCNPKMYHGVTTRIWDRLFGTLPADCEHDYGRVANRPALTGTSNLGVLWRRAS